MANITFESMSDLVKSTLPALGRRKFTDLTSDLREFTALKHIYDEKENATGRALQWNALGDVDQTLAHMVGIGQVDNYTAGNSLIQASVPWRHHNWHWSIDIKEIAAQADPADVIVELEFLRKKQSAIAFAFLMERQFWGSCPATADNLSLYGLRYWLVNSATAGFNGTLPTGVDGVAYTTVAGLDCTTGAQARWANYTNQFTTVSMDDFVEKLNRAQLLVNWVPPVEMPQYGKGESYGYYTATNLFLRLKRLALERGDGAEADLCYEKGSLMFNGVRVLNVPALDGATGTSTVGVSGDATHVPLIGISWDDMQYMVLKGRWDVQTGARRSPLQHETLVHDVDGSGQFRMTNRRRSIWLQSAAAIA